jgi:myosin heavy subunit
MSEFNFGTPVSFISGPSPIVEDSFADCARRQFEAEIREMGVKLSTAESATAAAESAKDNALKAESMARRILREHPHMDDYDRIVDLQEQVKNLKQENRTLRDEASAVSAAVTSKDAQLADKDDQIAALTADTDAQKTALADTKQELSEQQKAFEELDSHLTNAYADLKAKQSEADALAKARDDAESTIKERELDIEDLQEQVRQRQEAIDALDENSISTDELMRTQERLEADIEDFRTQISENDRTLQVKDARIAHLETQYQKALEGKLNAEAAASASAAQMDTPHIFTSGDASLQDELEAASDYSDDASTFQQLEISGITEIACVAPAAPTLSIGTIAATSIAPVTQQTATSSTQTDASKNNAISTQTDTPTPSYDLIHSVIADLSPVEPVEISNSVMSTQTDDVVILAERKSQTAAAQTVISNPPLRKTPAHTTFSLRPLFAEHERSNISTQTAPVVEKTPEPTVIHVVAPAQKRGRFSTRMLAIISAIAIFLCFYLFAQLQAYKTANGYGYGSRTRYSTGAFGHGRYLFGVIPIGFDIGPDWFSEQFCRTTSTAVATFEDWIGITPTPLY